VQAVFWQRYGVRISSHPQRLREIESNPDLVVVAPNYRRLYDLSQVAHSHPLARFDRERCLDLLETDLARVQNRVELIFDAT
jgi:hypothetical protein